MNFDFLPTINQPRRRFLELGAKLMLAITFNGIQGCSRGGPLKISGHVFPGYEFIFLARDEGWLKPDWVELLQTNSASESLEALASGSIDGAMLTLDETLNAREKGIPLTIVLILDRSVGADALLAAPELSQLSQLKGKRIGVENTAAGRLVLHFALQRAGLTLNDIVLLNLTVDRHLEACLNRTVDAIVSFEPSLNLIEDHGWQNLIDSREMDTLFDVLAVRTDKLSIKSLAITNLIEGHLKAAQRWRNGSIDTRYRLSQRIGISPTEVGTLYRGLDLPDLDYNRHMLSRPNYQLMQIAKKVADILDYPNALLDADENLFTADFLPRTLP